MKMNPLIIEKDRFLRTDGTQFDWFGHIDFMLFFRSLNGLSLEEHLAKRTITKEQVVSTLMMAHYIEHQDPRAYGDRFFAHIKPVARALAALGYYWKPIVFADAQVLMSDKNEQRTFLGRCAQEFSGEPNVIPCLGNELSKNGINPFDFVKPSGNLWSRGSETGDSEPPRPGWDWKDWHPRRDWPKVLFGNDDAWYVKEGVNSGGQTLDVSMPVIISEPIGFWDRDIPNRRSSDPNLARVIGGTARYFARGVDFMSEEGLRCDDWSDRTKECAVAMCNAMKQV